MELFLHSILKELDIVNDCWEEAAHVLKTYLKNMKFIKFLSQELLAKRINLMIFQNMATFAEVLRLIRTLYFDLFGYKTE